MFRKATVIAATLATATALTACGGSSSPTASKGNSSTSNQGHNGLKMAQCIRAHGVPNFPDPGSGPTQLQGSSGATGGGSVSVDGVNLHVSPQKLQQAMSQCQKYAPQGPPISGPRLAKIEQNILKMAECMRSHGVPNFPDPKVTVGPGGHGIGVRIGGKVQGGSSTGSTLDPNSPAFKRAQQECGGLMKPGLQKKAGS